MSIQCLLTPSWKTYLPKIAFLYDIGVSRLIIGIRGGGKFSDPYV